MTSIQSKVKSKVTEFLKFRKTLFRSIFAISAWSSKLLVDYDNMGPSLQLVGAGFFNFLLSKLSSLQTSRKVDITGLSKAHISLLLEARGTWSGVLAVLYVLCMLILPWPDPMSKSRSCGDGHQRPLGAFYNETETNWMA